MQVSGRLLGTRTLLSIVLLVATVSFAFQTKPVSAAQITQRTLLLESNTTSGDGGSTPGGVVNHRFTFTLPSTSNVGSIKFEYCTTASVEACVLPTGVVTTSATLGDNSTGDLQGFTLNNTTNGAPYVTRTAAAPTGARAANIRLDAVTNPGDPITNPNVTFFVRISTYASTDTTGSATDTGTVTASTATQIELTGTMPESLIFCTGETISTTNSIPDCSTATDGTITFNQLFSPSDTATARSQMAASTNATNGYSITVTGDTLTSGSNTIPAIAATATVPQRGISQFGMNLKLNTTAVSTVAIGAEVAPTSNGTDLRGQAETNYNTVDSFAFSSGAAVAASDFNTPGPTNSQIFTVSYIVNVAGSQPAGTYVSTLTYVCTPTF